MIPDNILTDRLLLRHWRAGDHLPFARMNADPLVMEFFPSVLSREESDLLAVKLQQQMVDRGYGLYAVELRQSHEFIGFTGLSCPSFGAHFTPCVEIGWRLAAGYWGQGLATEAASAVLKFGFVELGLEEVVSFTSIGNLRSRRVMEKLGMTHDAADDFCHPNLPKAHPLSRHVLYRLRRDAVRQAR